MTTDNAEVAATAIAWEMVQSILEGHPVVELAEKQKLTIDMFAAVYSGVREAQRNNGSVALGVDKVLRARRRS